MFLSRQYGTKSKMIKLQLFNVVLHFQPGRLLCLLAEGLRCLHLLKWLAVAGLMMSQHHSSTLQSFTVLASAYVQSQFLPCFKQQVCPIPIAPSVWPSVFPTVATSSVRICTSMATYAPQLHIFMTTQRGTLGWFAACASEAAPPPAKLFKTFMTATEQP